MTRAQAARRQNFSSRALKLRDEFEVTAGHAPPHGRRAEKFGPVVKFQTPSTGFACGG